MLPEDTIDMIGPDTNVSEQSKAKMMHTNDIGSTLRCCSIKYVCTLEKVKLCPFTAFGKWESERSKPIKSCG